LTSDGNTRNCYVMHAKWAGAFVLIVLGAFLMMLAGM
jgi:hypothetical protein